MPDGHIPATLKDFGIEMKGVPVEAGNYATIFVGIVNKPTYTDEMWDNHKRRIKRLFQITDDNNCIDVRVYSDGANSSVLHNETLQGNFLAALDRINECRTNQLRIVLLGIAASPGLHHGLIHLIDGWNSLPKDRRLQFVAMGESENFHHLNFCRRRICMTGLAATVHYYNTMDYNSFGSLQEDPPLSSRGSLQMLLTLKNLVVVGALLYILICLGSYIYGIFQSS